MDMPATTIASLPEEILLSIFEYLDSPAPSQLKARLEPTLSLTSDDENEHHILKSISQVSHLWRRIALPLLFRYSRLHLDVSPKAAWSLCPACGDSSSTSAAISVDENHKNLFTSALESIKNSSSNDESEGPSFTVSTLHAASRLHHATIDYLTFLRTHNLPGAVHSLVVLTSRMTEESQFRFPHQMAATTDYRYRAAAELWHQVFTVIPKLKRCVIVAPPADLARLTNCAIDLFGHWAFEDMAYHILELGIDVADYQSPTTSGNPSPTATTSESSTLSYVPEEYPGIAASSILKIRPWSHLGLNEGSFLRAYGTYEYFERGPPSLIYSIKDCLSSNRRAWQPHSQSGMDLSALKSFAYTAILPFANHCDFRGLLPSIDELDIKLAPDPSSGILRDKDRVGKAELGDCWREYFDAYRAITKPFRTFEIRPDGTPKLKKFVCRDMGTRGLQNELDDEFVPLCLPVWAEMEPGVFVRQAKSPPSYGMEMWHQ